MGGWGQRDCQVPSPRANINDTPVAKHVQPQGAHHGATRAIAIAKKEQLPSNAYAKKESNTNATARVYKGGPPQGMVKYKIGRPRCQFHWQGPCTNAMPKAECVQPQSQSQATCMHPITNLKQTRPSPRGGSPASLSHSQPQKLGCLDLPIVLWRH